MGLAPFLGALGQAFGGGVQGFQIQTAERQKEAAMQQAAQMHQAQMQDMAAQAGQRQQQTADLAQKAQANQRAFGTLAQIAPQHPLVAGGFNPGVDYIGELKNTSDANMKQASDRIAQRRNFNALRVEFPDVAKQMPFDEHDPANYTDILTNARDQRKVDSQSANQRFQSAGVDPTTGRPVLFSGRTGATVDGGGVKSNPNMVRAGAALPMLDDAISTLKQYSDPGVAGRLFHRNMLGRMVMSDEGANALQAYTQFARTYLGAKNGRTPSSQQIDTFLNESMPAIGEQGNDFVLKHKANLLNMRYNEIAQMAKGTVGNGATSAQAPPQPGPTLEEVLAKHGITPVRTP